MKERKQLAIQGFIKLLSGIIIMGLLLFISAGTISFPGAWRMIYTLYIPMIILGIILLRKAPELLRKRLNMKETEKEQKTVILFSALLFASDYVLCGLDYRFGWSYVPIWLVNVGQIVFLLSYIGFAELLRENAFLSRTVEVSEDQKVVSTGLYGIVRHPMYAIILIMFLSMPLIIGSFLGLVSFVFLPTILVKRIANEERVLENELKGYREYEKKIKYRMIPFIW